MKLSLFERRLLGFIAREYPIAWEKAEAGSMIAIGERLIPTRGDLEARFRRKSATELDKALKRLVGYQCIAKVYLFAEGDYDDISPAAGITIRSPVAGPASGVDAYQVTAWGKEVIASFPTQRIKRTLYTWAGKVADDYVPLIIAFLIGMLLSSLFGWDIRKLKQR